MENRKYRIDNETLKEIRDTTDWQRLFHALGIRKDERRSRPHDFWGWSPFTEEKTPSFHMSDKGFYCFSTHESGGVVELVQKVISHRTGQLINCYEAGQWIVDQGCSSTYGTSKLHKKAPNPPKIDRYNKNDFRSEKKINIPIRQNLIPLLGEQGTHPEFIKRGISKKTCEYLGCGYLAPAETKSQALQKMQDRIVFQVRGVQENQNGVLKPVTLSHVGRAINPEKISSDGKWRTYSRFLKTLELYNIDNLLLDETSRRQIKECGRILIVEGCFDIAKLVEAEIFNAVATFGAHLDEDQIPRLKLIAEQTGIEDFLIWYDRDKAGDEGQTKAIKLLKKSGFNSSDFDWNINFKSTQKGRVIIPETINDVCEFSIKQLQWLRDMETI